MGLDGLEPAAIDHYDSGQLILEAAAQELLFLAKPELAYGAIGSRTLDVVGRARSSLELFGPGRTKLGQVALVPALGERIRLDTGFGEAQLGTGAPSTAEAGLSPGPTY